MGFTTYENTANPHVTIHKDDCRQIKKHGGVHQYKQGQYKAHDDYSSAKSYATTTGLPVKDCSFCKPL